jgi:sigma-E factor negative regulatory protein RseA
MYMKQLNGLNITETRPVGPDQCLQSSELVSALMDGALDGEDFARALDVLAEDDSATSTWATYHLVGQAMRFEGEALQAHDPAFVSRLRDKLAENTPELIVLDPLSIRADGQISLKNPVANDPWWRRVAGLASVAVVGVLAWQGVVWMGAGRSPETTLAQQSVAPAQLDAPQALVTADGASSLMIRDPQLDALLAAHRQVGGANALQMPTGFLRNATFSEDKR